MRMATHGRMWAGTTPVRNAGDATVPVAMPEIILASAAKREVPLTRPASSYSDRVLGLVSQQCESLHAPKVLRAKPVPQIVFAHYLLGVSINAIVINRFPGASERTCECGHLLQTPSWF